MLFSGIPFLYYFLPAVILLYFLAPKKLKNTVLLFSSLFFYAWGEPRYLFLMLATILVGYVCGLAIAHSQRKVWKKVWLWSACTVFFGFLGYFKYAGFFVDNFVALTGISIPALKIALPIGISFYTFQILSYTVDVYREDVPAQRNLIDFACYVSLFPQLIAGPIVRYRDVNDQLASRKHSIADATQGVERFLIGLSKKVLLANLLGEFCDVFRVSDEKTVVFYWSYALAYTLHIYFDFSGYSDMAIGLGKIFGFSFPKNFDYPYISRSITEFWRRWHMTLGSWFRDYVYIPMGGNRVSRGRWLFNILTVWMLTGFWHGANWNFILWGLLYAVLLSIEKLFLKKWLDHAPRFLSHLYTMFFVILGFVLFAGESLSQVGADLSGIFNIAQIPFFGTQTQYFLRSYAVVFMLGIVGSTPIPALLLRKLEATHTGAIGITVLKPFVLLCLFILCTAYLVDGSFNPFLYFRF